MRIKKEDIKKIIDILESKYTELKEGEYYDFNGNNFNIIPDKWVIKDYPECKKFFENYNPGGYTCTTRAYLHYPKIKAGIHEGYSTDHCYHRSKSPEYTEITIEQFREFIKNKT